jgi:hypothetical protein
MVESPREGDVVLRYTAPVWVTVDLEAERVSKVEVGDTEVELCRNEGGFAVVVDASGGASPADGEAAARVAEDGEVLWPAWEWVR